jgi:UDP-2,3-diacylglucosamine pyrophosphatase LpxH
MNTFVISDFHMCDGGPRDRFAYGNRPKQLDAFLNFVEAQGGKLVVAGDLFDLWQCNFSKSVMHYMDLLDRLNEMEATYIVGNHDVDLQHFVGTHFLAHPLFDRMTGPYVLNDGKHRVKICHGHEADDYCADDMPGIGRITAILTALLEDRNGGPMRGKWSVEELSVGVLEKLVSWHERLWHKPQRDKTLIDGLKRYVDNGECDIVIGGHTHTPGRKGDWYFNSGCWCLRTNSFAWINDGKVSVWDWDFGPTPNNIVLG